MVIDTVVWDPVEIATNIVFHDCHKFKERYFYAAHIADKLQEAFEEGHKHHRSRLNKPGKYLSDAMVGNPSYSFLSGK